MELNIGNSIFPGMNDKKGLMVCGYEWGFSEADQKLFESGEDVFFDKNAITTFSNKSPAHGKRALTWRYDKRIVKWFELWNHPLSREGLGGDFEKLILQTNWCNTQGYKIQEGYYKKLINQDQIKNFIFHIEYFRPSLILFMGSEIINILQNPLVKDQFEKILGCSEKPPIKIQKPFSGRQFKIGFQKFENCQVVSLPHPSSSRGLKDEYIQKFEPEIGVFITELKRKKGINS